jgi:hypothetical protein
MYRSFLQMWEGWTKNLALLFPQPRKLAFRRILEFAAITACALIAVLKWSGGETTGAWISVGLAILFFGVFLTRIRRAHFDWLSDALALFGLPLFAVLLLNSDISHKRGSVQWKGRQYRGGASQLEPAVSATTTTSPHRSS